MRWVHLSDLHFNYENYDTDSLKTDLIRVLTETKDIDFVTVTGDCLYQYGLSDEIYKSLRGFITEITQACSIHKKNDLYIMPGNHDVNRNDTERAKFIQEIREKSSQQLNTQDIKNLQSVGYDRFKSIHKKLTGRDYTFSSITPRETYNIINIDTCISSINDLDAQQLILSLPNGKHTKKLLNTDKLNIVIMHHGIDFLRPDYAKKFQIWAEDNNIDIVLCGHSHRAGIKTFDELSTGLKQFTCGAAIVDGYAIPSFYIYDYDDSKGIIKVYLYTFSSETGRWCLDHSRIRAFSDGQYTYYIPRKNHYMLNDINNNAILTEFLGQEHNIITMINDKFSKSYGKKFFDLNGYQKDFSADTAVYSIVQMNVPYKYAIKIVNESVNTVCKDTFFAKMKGELHSKDFRSVIYDTISNLSPDDYYDKEDINTLASKYARRYGHNSQHIQIMQAGSVLSVNYQFTYDFFMDLVRDYADIENFTLTSNERNCINEFILSFIQSLDVYVLDYNCLKKFFKEIITTPPHPWLLIPEKEIQIRDYHFEKVRKHIANLSTQAKELTIIETVYHCSALFLSYYNRIIGYTEKYPITLLIKALNSISNGVYSSDGFFSKANLVELTKDLNAISVKPSELLDKVLLIEKGLNTEIKNISQDYLQAISEFSQITFKLKEYIDSKKSKKLVVTTDIDLIRGLSEFFSNIRGVFVKQPLKQANSCFWISPNFEENVLSFGCKQLLIALITDINFDEVINYTKNDNCIDQDKSIIFVNKGLKPFSPDMRTKIKDSVDSQSTFFFFDSEILDSIQNSEDRRKSFETWLRTNNSF